MISEQKFVLQHLLKQVKGAYHQDNNKLSLFQSLVSIVKEAFLLASLNFLLVSK